MRLRSALVAALLIVTANPSPAAASVTMPPPTLTIPSSGSFFYFNSEAGDYIGQGQERLYTNANAVLGGARRDSVFGAQVTVGGDGWGMTLAAPAGVPLVVGSYTGAMRASVTRPAGTPGLEVGGYGRLCNSVTGQFDVLDVQLSSLGEITVFDAVFEQHCEGLTPALYGRIRIESPAPAPGSALPPGSFSVPTTGTFLYLTKTNTNVGTYEQLYTTADSTFDLSWLYLNWLHLSVVQGNYVHWWYLDFASRPTDQLTVGHYADALRTGTSQTFDRPGLDISGDGHGCNEVSGSFDIDELSYAWNYEIRVFQATFHFYCDNALSLQHGRIRIERATPPPPPPVTLGLTIDEKGKATDNWGYATVSGTVSCSRSVPIDLRGQITQTKPDHHLVTGSISGPIDCIAPMSRWTMLFGGDDNFGASGADATVTAYYCDAIHCDTASDARVVRLNEGNN